MGCREGSCVAWVIKSMALSTSFLVFCCFDLKKSQLELLLPATACLVFPEE